MKKIILLFALVSIFFSSNVFASETVRQVPVGIEKEFYKSSLIQPDSIFYTFDRVIDSCLSLFFKNSYIVKGKLIKERTAETSIYSLSYEKKYFNQSLLETMLLIEGFEQDSFGDVLINDNNFYLLHLLDSHLQLNVFIHNNLSPENKEYIQYKRNDFFLLKNFIKENSISKVIDKNSDIMSELKILYLEENLKLKEKEAKKLLEKNNNNLYLSLKFAKKDVDTMISKINENEIKSLLLDLENATKNKDLEMINFITYRLEILNHKID